MAVFSKLIENSSKHAMYLNLYFQGEPYLHSGFFDMVKIAKKAGLYVATSTNAHQLTSENAALTVAAGLDRLIISFDGPDAGVYTSYRNGGEWDKVNEGVRNVVTARKASGRSYPYIILQCLLLKGNEKRINEVRTLASELGADRIEFKTLQLLNLSAAIELLPSDPRHTRYVALENGHLQARNRSGHCTRIFTSAVFTWDGKAVACCYDKDADFCFGSITKQSIEDIWKGKERKNFIGAYLKDPHCCLMCENCDG